MTLLLLLRTIRSARRSHAVPGQDHVRTGPITTLTRSRKILLARNGDRWQASFIHLDATGHEEMRFSSALLVVERFGQIEAALVNGSSDKTLSMVFSDLPVMVSATALPMHLPLSGEKTLPTLPPLKQV